MSSVINKKRVSFDVYVEEIVVLKKLYTKVDIFPKEIYDAIFELKPEIPVRVRSDSENEIHAKKYIGIVNTKN